MTLIFITMMFATNVRNCAKVKCNELQTFSIEFILNVFMREQKMEMIIANLSCVLSKEYNGY